MITEPYLEHLKCVCQCSDGFFHRKDNMHKFSASLLHDVIATDTSWSLYSWPFIHHRVSCLFINEPHNISFNRFAPQSSHSCYRYHIYDVCSALDVPSLGRNLQLGIFAVSRQTRLPLISCKSVIRNRKHINIFLPLKHVQSKQTFNQWSNWLEGLLTISLFSFSRTILTTWSVSICVC